jgi:hypothetical protein
MHSVEGAIGQYTQGKTTWGKRIPRRHVLWIPTWRDAEATLLFKAECTEPPSASTKIQLIECPNLDE